jgi:hypothetical protein
VARKRSTETGDDPHDDILEEYRRKLSGPAVIPGGTWSPVRIGPTWQTTEDGHWLLPERTIGWHVLAWCGRWLQLGRGKPWRFTDEQARFILWWFAVDETGVFTHRDGVLQRLKGWGKDPLGACLCATELVGPARFAGNLNRWPYVDATDVPDAWVQTAAVSLEQTKNTMRLFPGLFTAEAKAEYRLQIGKEQIHAMDGERFMQAVTSSPATLEGARGTFVLLNETQHWTASNDGHEMAAVIERNATKSPDGAARTLRITNAYEPGEDSVAERDREVWEKTQAGTAADTGLLYDSLEAHPAAPLDAESAPAVVWSISGDSVWLDTDRIVQSILDIRNPPSRSRRFWYNQVTATEDAWITPQEYDACADTTRVIADGEVITLGFDGSFSDDHTALIGCHVETDHLFEIGVWEPSPVTGEIDRAAVDLAVRNAFGTYDVVGFYADLHPWESYVDAWAEEFGSTLVVKAAVRQPVAWDMRGRLRDFTSACERMHAAIVERSLTHDGAAKMRQHFHNARRRPNRFGVSVGKEHRESQRKIDSVPAAILARLARLDYLATPDSRRRKKRSGRAAFF